MKAPRETDLVGASLAYLGLARVFAWRCNGGAVKIGKRFIRFASINGIADILGVLPDGRFLAVECKRPGGRVRPDQRAFLDSVTASGGLALVVRDVLELQRLLQVEGYEVP